MRQRVYLVRKGKQYLQAVRSGEGVTDTDRFQAVFTVYRYDAAQLPGVSYAQQIIRALRKDDDEDWSISRYNKLTYYEEVLS